MTNERAFEILCREVTCIDIRASGQCVGRCENCLLVLPDEEVKEAMRMAIEVLSERRKAK